MKIYTLRTGMTALAVAVSAFGAVPCLAQSSGETAGTTDAKAKKVTLNLENADVRYALKLLFQAAAVNYTIEAGVQGTVTASLTGVSFQTALESVLRTARSQAPLTYRVENGVYNVGLKREDSTVSVVAPKTPDVPDRKPMKVARIQLNYADPEDIAAALGGTMLPSRFAQFAGGGLGSGRGNGGTGNGMGNGMGNGIGGNSGIGMFNFGSGGSGLSGNFGNQPGGSGSGFIGSSGNSGNGSGNNGGNRNPGR